ncbi:hydrogenase nickel incorporation protein HypB [Nocardia sp. NPDC051750]|uniref:hydrogenase nickel incorporation protein HypB n=1 Tax=Nocardia sp. NPDC051750 TaxID=3364325 RepID=UPI0037A7D4B6
MCATCGCGNHTAGVSASGRSGALDFTHERGDSGGDDHHHGAGGDPRATETVILERKVLAANDHIAGHNRKWLDRYGILALNLTSSPGAGKTSLLERTIRDLGGYPIAVIEGDQETALDAERIRAAGARAVQVNTGAGCHLDARMTRSALEALDPEPGAMVFIENVGNLVCPALFDLGEKGKVVIVSVTEGADKPLKYPHMFAAAELVLVNKIDLLPFVDFDSAMFAASARSVGGGLDILPISATTGEGLDRWYDWLLGQRPAPA